MRKGGPCNVLSMGACVCGGGQPVLARGSRGGVLYRVARISGARKGPSGTKGVRVSKPDQWTLTSLLRPLQPVLQGAVDPGRSRGAKETPLACPGQGLEP